jgi:hypothetical protein
MFTIVRVLDYKQKKNIYMSKYILSLHSDTQFQYSFKKIYLLPSSLNICRFDF